MFNTVYGTNGMKWKQVIPAIRRKFIIIIIEFSTRSRI